MTSTAPIRTARMDPRGLSQLYMFAWFPSWLPAFEVSGGKLRCRGIRLGIVIKMTS